MHTRKGRRYYGNQPPVREDPIPSQKSGRLSLRTCSGPVEPDPGLESFPTILHRQLQAFGIRYCVLSTGERRDGKPARDLELAVHPQDWGKLLAVFCLLAEKDYRAVQVENPAAGISRFHFACLRHLMPSFRTVEVLTGSGANPLLRSAEEVVARRRKRADIWMAAPEDEFRYLLAKGSLAGLASDAHEQRLLQLTRKLSAAQASALAGELFGKQWQTKVLASCAAGRSIGLLLSKLKRRLWFEHWGRNPLRLLAYALKTSWEFVRRWFRPAGLLVVLLGPDGVGKSTFSAKILEVFRPVFASGRVLQWRPQVIKPREKNPLVFVAPHSKPPHGVLESIARLVAVLADYWVGQVALVKPLLARSGLIVYDRDFHDIMVDAYRYRYGGPQWLLPLAKKLMPRAECIFLTLEADPEIILQRKQEVTPEEVHRQSAAYRQLAAELPDSHVIRTDREFEQTLAEVSRILVSYLSQRFQRRHAFSVALVERPDMKEKEKPSFAT